MADDIRRLYGNARFVLRKDSLENWQTKNPVLLEGEPSYVTDGEDNKKIKIGDGVTPWNDLPYFSSGAINDQTYATKEELKNVTSKTNTLDKRVTNLEQGIIAMPFETDDSVAYQKIVPTNALPYAEVEKVGGMTRKCNNLIPFPYGETNKSLNGITWTVNADGSITANGTATANSDFYIIHHRTTLSLPSGEYFFICGGKSSTTYYGRVVLNLSGGGVGNADDFGSGCKLTLNDGDNFYILLRIKEGVTVSNLTFKPMLNEGTTALPDEPYFEGLRSAPVTEVESVGANHLMFPYNFTEKSSNGITAKVNSDGTITLNGTATANAFFDIHYPSSEIGLVEGETYFISDGVNRTDAYVRVLLPDGTGISHSSFVYVPRAYPQIRVSNGVTVENVTFKPMISKVKGLPFTPYREPIFSSIPEAVQNLDGYGWGVNDTCYNYIDFENKQFVKRVGKVDLSTLYWGDAFFDSNTIGNTFCANIKDMALPKTEEDRKTGFVCENYSPSESVDITNLSDKGIIRYEDGDVYIRDNSLSGALELAIAVNGVMLYYELAEPIITDISNLITEDNFIEVEGGGTLTFKNEYEYAVPSEITYQLRG